MIVGGVVGAVDRGERIGNFLGSYELFRLYMG
jgi:hypothetical protein